MSASAYDALVASHPDIIHYYKGNEPPGATQLLDSIGTLDSINVNDVIFGNPGGCSDLSGCVSGFVYQTSGSIQFPAPGPWPTIGPLYPPTRQSFTIEMAFKITAGHIGVQRLLCDATTGGPQLMLQSGGGTIQVFPNAATFRPDDGAWHLYQFTFDGTTGCHYLDGLLKSTNGAIPSYPLSADTLYIGDRITATGALGSLATFDGSFQKLAFYNGALSASEVADHWAAYNGTFISATALDAIGGGAPYYSAFTSNPFTMTGTQVNDVLSNADMIRFRTHRQAMQQNIISELWYNRDTTWSLFPIQPLADKYNHPTIEQQWTQPATLQFQINDPLGDLMPENMNSPYNTGMSGYDPLIDEARQITLRVGTFCWNNLISGANPASTSIAPDLSVGGAATTMTDGSMQPGDSPDPSQMCCFGHNNTTNHIVYDLGSPTKIYHTCIRFVQKNDIVNSTFPSSVAVSLSLDNIKWTNYPAQPIEDDTVNNLPGDWANSLDGLPVEICTCDINFPARYVKFSIYSSFATSRVMIDEIAIYGGTTGEVLGGNLFNGYMGNVIDASNDGHIQCTVTDATKKAADNNEVRLTAAYILVDAFDIIASLLQSSAYWNGATPYQTGFPNTSFGWFGTESGLVYPQYQGQSNSIFGYCQELSNSLGFLFYVDGNGIWQLTQPPYRQYQPSRVMGAGPATNNDCRKAIRHRTGNMMRNKIDVGSGPEQSGQGIGGELLFEPNSIAKYGSRKSLITDPILNSPQLRDNAAQYFLRDYAWRLQRLEITINPDLDTRLKSIHAFKCPARPSLYSKNSSYTGNKRLGEMWTLDAMTQHITNAEWYGDAHYIPYVPWAVGSPQVTTLTPGTGTPDPVLSLRLAWNAITDLHVASINVYISPVSENTGFVQTLNGISASATSGLIQLVLLNPLVLGDTYWVYATCVSESGQESLPSAIVSATVGSVAGDTSEWTVTDFTFGLIDRSGPDVNGYYSYQFEGSWDSPSAGFKRMAIYLCPYAQPDPVGDPTAEHKSSWPIYNNTFEWHGNYIPPGDTWDRVTPGPLTWPLYFRTKTNFLSGQRMYARIFTSSATTRWRKWGGDSDFDGWPGNIAFCTF